MKKYLLRIWDEIKSGQNIDVYLTIIICFALLVFDIFGIASQNVVSSGILATLLLITLNSLNTRQVNNELQQALKEINVSKTSMSFFHEWDDVNFSQKMAVAKDISVMAVSPYEFVNYNSERLRALARQGAILRFAMINPDGEAIKMTSLIFHGAAKQTQYITTQVRMTLQKIQEIALESNQNNVQVKLIDNIPPSVMTMINSQGNDGTIFVTLNGIDCPTSSRPSFSLLKSSDGKWFEFYENGFENLWNSTEARELKLTK
jgi:hypothetical protein